VNKGYCTRDAVDSIDHIVWCVTKCFFFRCRIWH